MITASASFRIVLLQNYITMYMTLRGLSHLSAQVGEIKITQFIIAGDYLWQRLLGFKMN